MLGGMLGIAVGILLLAAVKQLAGDQFEIWQTAGLDWRAAAVAFAMALVSALIFGVIPALQASRVDVHAGLREGGTRTVAAGSGGWTRRILVVAEVALGERQAAAAVIRGVRQPEAPASLDVEPEALFADLSRVEGRAGQRRPPQAPADPPRPGQRAGRDGSGPGRRRCGLCSVRCRPRCDRSRWGSAVAGFPADRRIRRRSLFERGLRPPYPRAKPASAPPGGKICLDEPLEPCRPTGAPLRKSAFWHIRRSATRSASVVPGTTSSVRPLAS